MTTSILPLWFVCQHCGDTFTPKRRDKNATRTYCSRDCYDRARLLAGRNGKDRRTRRYARWRDEVALRDEVCQGMVERGGVMARCGSTLDLHAHHIARWVDHPERRWDPENGILLCYDCHARRHPDSGIGPRRSRLGQARACAVCGTWISGEGSTGLCHQHAMDAYSARRYRTQWEKDRRLGKTCRVCGVGICDDTVSGLCKIHMGPYISAAKRASKAP